MFLRQVLRYTWITTTKVWRIVMLSKREKFHRTKRKKNSPKAQLKLLTWQNIDSTWSLFAHACKL
jgi:hypothetical protein